MRKIIIVVLSMLLIGCSSEQTSTSSSSSGTFPVYGNWCGPDHPKAGMYPEPIDEVDAACKEHDACYATNGYFDCECDTKLMASLKNIKENKLNVKKQLSLGEYIGAEKAITRKIKIYFATTVCVPHNPLSIVGAVPTKVVTAADTGTDAIGVGAISVVGTAYTIITLPFIILAKGLCAIHETDSCYRVK